MSQETILTALKRAKNGMTAAKLAKVTGTNYSTAQASCRKLRNNNEIDSLLARKPYMNGSKHPGNPTYYYYAKGKLKRGKKK